MYRRSIFAAAMLGVAATGFAEENISQNEAPIRSENVFTPGVVLTQGVVEGLTEYLPVSSTGHLILANGWMNLDTDSPLLGRDGAPITTGGKPGLKDRVIAAVTGKEAEPKPVEAYTVKQAADDYSIVIQFGAIIAVLFAFHRRIFGMIGGVLRGRRDSIRLARNLLIAFTPAAALGLLLGDLIDKHLFNPYTVAGALVAGGLVMLAVEKLRKKSHPNPAADSGPDLHEMTVVQSATIGACQCAALIPGTSRSMSTIVGGYVAGLSPARATEFSFLLGLITLTAASAYKTLKHGPELVAAFSSGTMLLGMSVAAVVAFVSVKWMIGWITRHGLSAFAWYRFALAGFVLAWFLLLAND